MIQRQRVDLWLFRARFAKTRAEAARFIAEGGMRLLRDGAGRRLEKGSADIASGDVLVFSLRGRLICVRVRTLAARRGPAAEARGLYSELDADALA
jgi:ribosome-associated heat shock protein Hsp15